MIVPDSNLLLYAYNQASPYHKAAKRWWESCLSGTEPVGLTYPVIFSFLRVSTSTRAFPIPYTLEEAAERIERWLDQSVTRILQPAASYVVDVVQLLEGAGSTGGNLVTDAQIAVIAMNHNGTVHTADQDFRRFRGLKFHYPLEQA